MKVKDTDEGIQIYDFNPKEAFKIARKLENEGVSFYKKLLEAIEDSRAKEVIIYLLDEEKDHLKLFEKMLEGEDPEALDNGEEDILNILDDRVFALPHDGALATDLDNALKLGVVIEKRSLAFYLEILKYTDSEEGKSALRKIIKEEKKHWEELQRLID